MSIFTDSIGNVFLGDCIWANHNPAFPTVNHLLTFPFANISANLSSWLASSGLNYSSVVPQSTLDRIVQINTSGSIPSGDAFDWFRIRFSSDNLSVLDRLIFKRASSSTNDYVLAFRNNTNTANLGQLAFVGDSNSQGDARWYPFNNGDTGTYPTVVTGVADSNSLGFLLSKYVLNDTQSTQTNKVYQTIFCYSGILEDINTNFNYYSNNVLNKHIFILLTFFNGSGTLALGNAINARTASSISHYISQSSQYKSVLVGGDAQYPIVCADSQTPTEYWATDLYVFDDNSTLGFPCIGRVKNLLVATGNLTLLKPVKIQGTVKPDNGFNRWLPVGYWGERTVLMRCYSSITL